MDALCIKPRSWTEFVADFEANLEVNLEVNLRR